MQLIKEIHVHFKTRIRTKITEIENERGYRKENTINIKGEKKKKQKLYRM